MASKKLQIEIARAYEQPKAKGKYCILIDRIWPRGIKKEDLPLDAWMKEIAPTTELRKWFDHDPEKYQEFKKRYTKELDKKKEELSSLLEEAGKQPILLLYGAKDTEHNQAVVLKDYLEAQAGKLQS